ncbi:MAG: hypothetical protein V2A71_10340 [Candidatus Eisenbacteria bacterium]
MSKVNTLETLFARYFDGDLDDREARDFLEKVAADPKLESELRAYERLLALGKELPVPRVPAGFAKRVMSALSVEGHPERLWARPWGFQIPWRGLAVAAAAVVLAYIGGWLVGHRATVLPGAPDEALVRSAARSRSATTPTDPGIPLDQGSTAASDFQYVRLLHVPTDASVSHVSIAGSFNNWDPAATPLRRKNGVWVTILVLPPGSYEYMFVEDNKRWVTDPLAVRTRDDGFGSANAVLDVEI